MLWLHKASNLISFWKTQQGLTATLLLTVTYLAYRAQLKLQVPKEC